MKTKVKLKTKVVCLFVSPMKASFISEWPALSIGSVGLSVVAATVTVISRRGMMDGDQGMGEVEVQGEGE